MWLLKFHDRDEFCHCRISDQLLKLRTYLEKEIYDVGEQIEILKMESDLYQVIVDGDEVGFIGEVEVL